MERFKKQKLINEKVAECLKRIDPKTPKFYLRPKLHIGKFSILSYKRYKSFYIKPSSIEISNLRKLA